MQIYTLNPEGDFFVLRMIAEDEVDNERIKNAIKYLTNIDITVYHTAYFDKTPKDGLTAFFEGEQYMRDELSHILLAC